MGFLVTEPPGPRHPPDRRLPLLSAWLAALALISVVAGCSSRSPATSPPTVPSTSTATPAAFATGRASPATPPPTRPAPATIVTAPPTTTTTVPRPPPLLAPTPIRPLVSPSLPGEGVWQPAMGATLAHGYPVYTTQLRSGAGYPPAGIAWIDSAATRIASTPAPASPTATGRNRGQSPSRSCRHFWRRSTPVSRSTPMTPAGTTRAAPPCP